MAERRVYWKGLILVLRALVGYIQRNQTNLQRNLTDDEYTCVVAVLNAGVTCLAALPINSPVI